MRAVIVTLHMLGGFVAAVFVVVLGLTGSIMAFEDELDHLTHPHLFKVTPAGTPMRNISRRRKRRSTSSFNSFTVR